METHPGFMKISLVMATLGRTREVESFLASLDAQKYRNFDLIVVDQNPDDRLSPLLSAHGEKFPILYLRSNATGASRARNLGLEHAEGDIVAFPDDDCRYPPDLLNQVARFFSMNPEKAGLTGRSTDEKGRSNMGNFSLKPGPLDRINVWKQAIEYTMFFRGKTARSLRFDETMGQGAGTPYGAGEGTDYLLRLLEREASLHYDPSLTVVHQSHTPPYNTDAARKTHAYGYGMGYVLKKNRLPLWLKVKYLIRPLGGTALSLLRLKLPESNYQWNSFKGRLKGLFS